MALSKPLYREILKNAWQLTWKNKSLWILGFLATFLGTSGVLEIILRGFGRVYANIWSPLSLIQSSYPGAPFVTTFFDLQGSLQISLKTILVPIILLLIFIGLLWICASAEGGLIWAIKNKKKTAISASEAFIHGKKFGFRIILINIISKLLIALSFLATSLPMLLVFQRSGFGFAMLYFVTFIIFFPLILIISFLTIFTICGMVLHNKHLGGAVADAWHVFRKNWLISIETSLILFGISLISGLAVALFAILLFMPIMLLSFVGAAVGIPSITYIVMVLALIVLVALIVVTGSILTTFQINTWTLLYEQLVKAGGLSKIVRIIRSIPKLIFSRG